MSTLKSPNTMVFWSQKCVRASSKYGRCSRVEEGVFSDERGPFSGDELAAHHIWLVKVRQLDAPSLMLVPDNRSISILCVAVRRRDRLQAHHSVSHPVLTIHMSVILVSIRIIIPKPPIHATWKAYKIPKPQPLRIW